jgi:hypothetical protein
MENIFHTILILFLSQHLIPFKFGITKVAVIVCDWYLHLIFILVWTFTTTKISKTTGRLEKFQFICLAL